MGGRAGTCQRIAHGRGAGVDADQLHAQAQAGQARIVETGQRRHAGRAGKDEGRAVVGLRGRHARQALRHAHQQVADAGQQGLANEAAPVRQPGMLQRPAEPVRQQHGQAVFQAGARGMRQRHVVGVGTDAQRCLGAGSGGAEQQGRGRQCPKAGPQRALKAGGRHAVTPRASCAAAGRASRLRSPWPPCCRARRAGSRRPRRPSRPRPRARPRTGGRRARVR